MIWEACEKARLRRLSKEQQKIGPKVTASLALLCVLSFSVIAVQSAGATVSNNTTAVTCVKGGGELDFSDAHCDKKVEVKKGEYGHVDILGQIEIEASNVSTGETTVPSKLFGEPFKVQTEIECTVLKGTGTLTNLGEGTNHKVTGTATTEFSKCTVKKPVKCTVKEPIVATSTTDGVDELEGKKEMGLEFKPTVGTTFSTVTLEGAECALKGKPFNVEGTAIGTSGSGSQTSKHTGATLIFTKAMTEKTLKTAEKFAWFEATATVKKKENEKGNPIALTTT